MKHIRSLPLWLPALLWYRVIWGIARAMDILALQLVGGSFCS